jgi:hypothetical protein
MELSRRGFFGILGSALSAVAIPGKGNALVRTAAPPATTPAFRLEIEAVGSWITLGRLSGGNVTINANAPGSAFLEIAAFHADCAAGLRYCLVTQQIRRFRVVEPSGMGAEIMGYVVGFSITGKIAGEISGNLEILEAIRERSARSVSVDQALGAGDLQKAVGLLA